MTMSLHVGKMTHPNMYMPADSDLTRYYALISSAAPLIQQDFALIVHFKIKASVWAFVWSCCLFQRRGRQRKPNGVRIPGRTWPRWHGAQHPSAKKPPVQWRCHSDQWWRGGSASRASCHTQQRRWQWARTETVSSFFLGGFHLFGSVVRLFSVILAAHQSLTVIDCPNFWGFHDTWLLFQTRDSHHRTKGGV